MAEDKRKQNDFDVAYEDLSSSWKRAVVGLFDQPRLQKFQSNLEKAGSNFWKENIRDTSVAQGVKDLFNSVKKVGKNVKDGAVELFNLIKAGDWKKIGAIWGEVYENDPAAWLAGSIAAAGATVIAFMGARATAAAMGSIPFIGTGVARLGGLKAWLSGGTAALLKNPLGTAITIGGLNGLLQVFVKAAAKIYNFDWQVSDEDYQKSIDNAIESLYEPAGEFLGRASGAFIAARLSGNKPPRAQVDITALAILHEIGDDEIKEEIEDAASEFMNTGLRTFMGIGITYLYTSARHFLVSMYNKIPSQAKKFLEKVMVGGKANVNDAISNWGNKGNEGWSVKKEIDLEGKIESIDDPKLRGFLLGFFDNFWDTFSECVSYSSAFKGAY